MSLGLHVVLSEGVDRVAHGPVVGLCQPVGEDLALEATHVARVKILAEQVVGFHPVVVDQGDGGLPSLEEAAETLGDKAAGAAAAHHRYLGIIQQERVVQIVGHFQLPPTIGFVGFGTSSSSRIRGGGPSKTCDHPTGAKWP